MKQKTFDDIRTLTKSDFKSLTQKALKSCEEVGELAKVVLPFENAYATTHRFVDKDKILEEVCDVVLTTLSVAYELEFNDDDIDAMLNRKIKKWAEMQHRETKADYPVPYEIHITVTTDDIPKFKNICDDIGVKPIVIDLQNRSGVSIMDDVMTSSTHVGNNNSVYIEMKRISDAMVEYGLTVLREKIETVPWHPAAPSNDHADKTMPKDCYFEAHFGVLCTNETLPKLGKLAKNTGSHLSRNAFKKHDDGRVTMMITHRRKDCTSETFANAVEAIKQTLAEEFEVKKVIVEFSVFDTKVNHDATWITNNT